MRKAAGLLGDQMAADLGWGRAKISRIENGHQIPSADDIRAWAEATGHPEDIADLLALREDVQAIHTGWRRQLRHGHKPVQDELARRAAAAKRICSAANVTVPGLLQTAGYARAIIAQFAEVWDTGDVDAAVEARMRRQDILYDRSKTIELVTTEAALRFLYVPRQVMLGQLDRLLSIDLDNVTFGIIPMGVDLAAVPLSNFLLLDDRVIVENYGAADEPGEDESAVYARVFDLLMAEAATGEEARRLIAAAAEDLRK
jgi:transcriptional regulator with XRE-family HTH domain